MLKLTFRSGAFVKQLPKAANLPCRVCPSSHQSAWNGTVTTGHIIMKHLVWGFYQKGVDTFQF
jgi:hypothetical protein